MSYIGGPLPGQERDEEYPQDIGKETFQKGVKSISDTYQKLPEPVKKNVSEASRFGGEIFSGLAEMNREARESNILGLGPLDPFIGATKLYDKAIEGVSDITGIYKGYFDLADFFIPATPTALKLSKRLSTTNKATKLTNVAELNRLTNLGEAITRKTGIKNVARDSGVVQFLNSTNVDDIFKGSTLDTIKNIQKQYPITPKNLKVITPKEAKLRNQAMFEKGINVYEDELGMLWKRLGEGRWRNTTARNATRQKINQITGLPGTRRNSTINYINKRSRDLVASNADEVKHVNSIYSSRDAINQRLKLVKGDRNFMTVEHRIGQSDWKKLGLEGNPHDSVNLWLTTTYEATVKTKIENTLRGKAIKGNYIVDFNPQNNALHVMKLENFKLNELPKGKRFKKNAKGDYNLQAIEKYLKTLE